MNNSRSSRGSARTGATLGSIRSFERTVFAPRCRNDEHAFVDALGLIEIVVSLGTHLLDANTLD
jgi:hypothetical protein